MAIYQLAGEGLQSIDRVSFKAREAGVLLPSQEHIAVQAEQLVRGSAHLGIVALVDEATGYQEARARKALEEYLGKQLRAYAASWAKRFPDEYYIQIYRLKGWE